MVAKTLYWLSAYSMMWSKTSKKDYKLTPLLSFSLLLRARLAQVADASGRIVDLMNENDISAEAWFSLRFHTVNTLSNSTNNLLKIDYENER